VEQDALAIAGEASPDTVKHPEIARKFDLPEPLFPTSPPTGAAALVRNSNKSSRYPGTEWRGCKLILFFSSTISKVPVNVNLACQIIEIETRCRKGKCVRVTTRIWLGLCLFCGNHLLLAQQPPADSENLKTTPVPPYFFPYELTDNRAINGSPRSGR
jgi:hypothetical protein